MTTDAKAEAVQPHNSPAQFLSDASHHYPLGAAMSAAGYDAPRKDDQPEHGVRLQYACSCGESWSAESGAVAICPNAETLHDRSL